MISPYNLSHQLLFNTSQNALKFSHNMSSSNTTSFTPEMTPTQILTWTTVTMLICVIGCLNNTVVFCVTYPRPGEKSGVNLLMLHFVFANWLHCFFHVPSRCVMVQAKQSANYSMSMTTCTILQTFNSASWLVVYWADASLAVNRCVALLLPHSYRTYSKMAKNVFQIVLMWILSVGLLLPYDYGIGGYVTILVSGHCAYRGRGGPYADFYNLVKYGPFLINGVASALILWKCYVVNAFRVATETSSAVGPAGAAAGGHGTTVVRHRILLAKLLVIMFAWSVFSNFPSNILIAFDATVFERLPIMNLWMQTAVLLQYAFCPLILLASNTKYQERLRRLIQRLVPLLATKGNERGKSVRMTRINSISKTAQESLPHNTMDSHA